MFGATLKGSKNASREELRVDNGLGIAYSLETRNALRW